MKKTIKVKEAGKERHRWWHFFHFEWTGSHSFSENMFDTVLHDYVTHVCSICGYEREVHTKTETEL